MSLLFLWVLLTPSFPRLPFSIRLVMFSLFWFPFDISHCWCRVICGFGVVLVIPSFLCVVLLLYNNFALLLLQNEILLPKTEWLLPLIPLLECVWHLISMLSSLQHHHHPTSLTVQSDFFSVPWCCCHRYWCSCSCCYCCLSPGFIEAW